MNISTFAGSGWVVAGLFGWLLPSCASSGDDTGTNDTPIERRDAAAPGDVLAWGAGGNGSTGVGAAPAWGMGGTPAAAGGPSGEGTATGGAAGKPSPSSGAAGGSSPGASADAGAAGAACTPGDLAKLLATTDGGASIAISCLLGPCLLDVVGHVGPCLSQCLQTDTGMAKACGDCVGREVEAARDACLAQCADDFACYGDCALGALGTAGEHCAL